MRRAACACCPAPVAMLVDRPEYYDLYRAVQADAAAAPVTVLVSAADCDSCATFRTLRALFKADAVTFSAFPVAGYEDLQRRGQELPRDGAVRARRRAKSTTRLAAFKPAANRHACARARRCGQLPRAAAQRWGSSARGAGARGDPGARCACRAGGARSAALWPSLAADSLCRACSRAAWCSSTAAAPRTCGACWVRAPPRAL